MTYDCCSSKFKKQECAMFKGEKIFSGEVDVKYYFQKSYKKTDSLTIVFSAFPAMGKPPTYNFIRTLEEFDSNKLFILDDFGCRASYYLCKNREYTIERSVIKLINSIINEHEIKTIISCGSSKGGYAALYYGIKYGFDYIISASPQYLLGDYLLKQTNSKAIVEFMSGSATEEDHTYLNEIMAKMINNTTNKPNIFIHLGERENHYTNHVKPLLADLDRCHINYTLDLGDYSNHSDVAQFFPQILKDKIRKILGFPSLKVSQSHVGTQPINSKCTFIVETDSQSNLVAWYIFHNNTRIDATNYSNNREYTIHFKEKGSYRVKAFIINEQGKKVSTFSEAIQVK